MSDVNFDAGDVMKPAHSVANLRINYDASELHEHQLAATPLEQFTRWLNDAIALGRDALIEPNAMVLSTSDLAGTISSRTVLLKGIDERGLIFYSNYGSRKAQEMAAHPQVTALFPWYPLHRQVIVSGTTSLISREESAQYFASRPHKSQLGAIVSNQSEVIDSREILELRMAQLEEQYPENTPVPMPDFWGGFLITIQSIEFWQGRRSRLHDRLKYCALSPTSEIANAADWNVQRLSP